MKASLLTNWEIFSDLNEKTFEIFSAPPLLLNWEFSARALSAMNPEYIGLLTLMVEPGTPLERWVREGSFQVLGPAEILQETALLLDHMDSPGSVFRMNHASNYLTLKGTLNRDLPALRQQVQEGLMGHGLRPESWRAL